jgi:hypothetical protein
MNSCHAVMCSKTRSTWAGVLTNLPSDERRPSLPVLTTWNERRRRSGPVLVASTPPVAVAVRLRPDEKGVCGTPGRATHAS